MLTMSLVGSSGFFGDFGAVKKKVRTAKKAPMVAKPNPFAATISKDVAKRLQAALVALGKVAGSATLKAVKVDGALGAGTAAAVNLAFTKHIGAGQASPQYRTGKMPLDYIKSNATVLAGMIEAEVQRRGGAASPTSVKVAKAVVATKAAAVAKAAAAATPQAVVISKDVAKQLQAALVTLGKIAGSAQLKAVKVDGAPGAKTAAAVNFAFTKHLGAGQAPAQYRTGKMPLDYIKANARELTRLLETEIKRRGGTPASAALVAKSQPKATGSALKAANKALAAKTKADKAAAKKAAALSKRDALKASAAAKRAQAANVRAYAPAAADVLDKRAAEDEAAAGDATKEAVAAATDESSAGAEAQVAANEADEIATTTRTVAVQAVRSLTPSASSSSADSGSESAAGPGGPTEASMIPSVESGSFLDRYKYPLIGGVALLGLLAVMMNKRPTSAKKPAAPGMNGARRRRSRGRR